jgi:hypothetical protein
MIFARLPKITRQSDRTKIARMINKSINALNAGHAQISAQMILLIKDRLRISAPNLSGLGLTPWIACETHCKHHLDNGDPETYAICYWGCVVLGGPP